MVFVFQGSTRAKDYSGLDGFTTYGREEPASESTGTTPGGTHGRFRPGEFLKLSERADVLAVLSKRWQIVIANGAPRCSTVRTN